MSRAQWCMHLIPAPRRQRQAELMSWKPALSTLGVSRKLGLHRDSLFQKKKEKKKKKEKGRKKGEGEKRKTTRANKQQK